MCIRCLCCFTCYKKDNKILESVIISKNKYSISYEMYLYDYIINDKKFTKKFNIIYSYNVSHDKITFLCKYYKTNYLVIVKIYLNHKKTNSEKNDENIYNIMKLHNNEHIQEFIGYVNTEKYRYVILKYIEGISLYDKILKKTLTNMELILITRGILKGVNELHKCNILHCDIKPNNIIIDKNNTIKIIDFDLSKISSDDYLNRSICGTVDYISPESYFLKIYSKKTDIWSIGITIYNMITHTYPFDGILIDTFLEQRSQRSNPMKYPDMERLQKNIDMNNYDNIFYDLIKGMLTYKDSDRYSINYSLKLLEKI